MEVKVKKILLSSLIAVLCLTVVMSLFLAGCKTTTTETTAAATVTETTAAAATAAETTAPQKTLKFGALYLSLEHPFYIMNKTGMEETAKKLGVEMIILDSQSDVAKQANQIDDLIAQKVDAIIISPVEPKAAIDMVKKCNDAGIPVIDQASKIDANVATTVLRDDEKMGLLAGEGSANWINENLNGKGKIAVFNWPTFSNTKAWEDGFLAKIKELSPQSEIISTIPGTSKEEGLNGMEDVLQSHPEVNFIFGINDPIALGAIQAIDASGRKDIFASFICGGDEEAFKRLQMGTKEGKIVGIVQLYPYEDGQLCVQAAYDAVMGKQLPPIIYSGGGWWTPENVEYNLKYYPAPAPSN